MLAETMLVTLLTICWQYIMMRSDVYHYYRTTSIAEYVLMLNCSSLMNNMSRYRPTNAMFLVSRALKTSCSVRMYVSYGCQQYRGEVQENSIIWKILALTIFFRKFQKLKNARFFFIRIRYFWAPWFIQYQSFEVQKILTILNYLS